MYHDAEDVFENAKEAAMKNKKEAITFPLTSDSEQTKRFSREEIIARNMRRIAEYDLAKAWRKTKTTENLINKYRETNGEVKENGFFMEFDLFTRLDGKISVSEHPAIKIEKAGKPKVFYELGNGWKGEIKPDYDPNSICVWGGNKDTLKNVIEFAKQAGVKGLTETKIKKHIIPLLAGFKVYTRLTKNWMMFSPIIGNGLILCFYRNTDQQEGAF